MSPHPIRELAERDLGALAALLGECPTMPAPGERHWLAVDTGGAIVASARLVPRIGLAQPRCWYHVGLAVHAAPELQLHRQQRTLLLGNDLTGSAELGALALAPGADAAALIALVELARHTRRSDPARWGERLIAELPGVRDPEGQSPFWQGLTRHFYRGDAQEARARLGAEWRSHLAALLPRQLIYASFLSPAAQAAIGGHAAGASGLRAALEAAGLRYREQITIDDGAAVLEGD